MTSSLSPEKRAYMKQGENITRFETWCILRNIACTGQMREEVRAGCVEWYKTNERLFIPSQALLGFAGIGKEILPAQTLVSEANRDQ